jgi:two-component system chemotaxis response regulator CheB
VDPDEPFTGADAFPVVALVASAGGRDALRAVLGPLPVDFPAAVIALQHLSPDVESRLPEILAPYTHLPVRTATEGMALVPGEVLVAPAGRHLLIGGDARVHLILSGRLPPARPSADLLLVSLAVAMGPRVLAVVLTGRGDDGALGAQAVTSFGGRTLVQDEASSVEFGMPSATLRADSPGAPVPLAGIAEVLQEILRA